MFMKSPLRLCSLVLLLLIVAACSTTPQVIVVTATPAPTETSTATPSPTAVPTSTALPSNTPSAPTPTIEQYSPDKGCALLNPLWDDSVDGCLKNRNGNFTQGLTAVNGVALPLRWSLWKDTNSIPMECDNNGCTFITPGTNYQSSTGISQSVSGLEPGQCYLLKGVYTFRLKTSAVDPNRDWTKPPEDFPINNVFAYARVNNTRLDMRLFEKETDKANQADANLVSGTRSYIWAIRGGVADEATMTLGLHLIWGSTLSGSRVKLIGAYWFAAPDGFCNGSQTIN